MYRYHVAGMPQDSVIAYMLWNLAAASGNMQRGRAARQRARQMTQEQIEEGQALSRNWKPGTPLPRQSRTGGG
jgi:hypothetical protein